MGHLINALSGSPDALSGSPDALSGSPDVSAQAFRLSHHHVGVGVFNGLCLIAHMLGAA